MTVVAKVFTASAACSAAALSAACLIAGAWQLAAVPAALAAFWAFGRIRGFPRLSAAPFPLLTLFAAIGLLAGLSPALCLAAVLCALCAWDLLRFTVKRAGTAESGEAKDVERRHLVRLACILGCGGLLGASGLFLRIRLDFVPLLLLGIVLTVGFAGALRLSRAPDDGDG